MRFDKKGKNGLPILIRCDDVWQVKQLIKLVRSGKLLVNYVENWSHLFTILRYNCFGVVDGNEVHHRDSDGIEEYFDVIDFKQFMTPTIIEVDANGDEIKEVDYSLYAV